MRPVPIPDHLVRPGQIRRVLAPPSGDLCDPHVAPIEILATRPDPNGWWLMQSLWVPVGTDHPAPADAVVVLTVVGGTHPPVALEILPRTLIEEKTP